MNKRDLTIKEAQLIKRTAWHNAQDAVRTPKTAQDVEDNWTAVRMITLVGCLDYAMIDLLDALVEDGRYKQIVKKNYNSANKLVMSMHDELFRLVNADNKTAGACYNTLVDRGWYTIVDNVSLSGVERSYNIVVSLCRLIEQANKKMRSKYWYRPVDNIGHILDLLSVIKEKDYNLDFCIDKSVVIR